MKKQILSISATLLIASALVLTSCNKEDTNAPVITLKGDASMTVDFKGTYAEPGATATDMDGKDNESDISSSIVTSGTVNTSSAEAYMVKYNVTDEAGNVAPEVSRTVNVVIKNSNMTGSYSCTDQVGGGSASNFTDITDVGSTPNSLKLPKFALYTNTTPSVYIIIKGTNGTEVELPTQTVNANGSTTIFEQASPGSISKDGKVITINYKETSGGTTVTGTNVYTKQ
jgi:hypothetical protein